MYGGHDELPLGFSMLFGYGLAAKEYFDSFPNKVKQHPSPRKFNLDAGEEMQNNGEETD